MPAETKYQIINIHLEHNKHKLFFCQQKNQSDIQGIEPSARCRIFLVETANMANNHHTGFDELFFKVMQLGLSVRFPRSQEA